MNKKLTPLAQLIEEIYSNSGEGDKWIIAQAKSLLAEEKQMVIDAYCQGMNDCSDLKAGEEIRHKDENDYFNQNYKQ
jgi:hypothetical protein